MLKEMRFLVALCLVMLAGLLAAGAWAAYQASLALEATRGVVLAVPLAVERQVATARQDLIGEVQDLRQDLRGEVAATRRDVLLRVDRLQVLVDDHAGRLEGAVAVEIGNTRRDLVGELGETRKALLNTIQPVTGEAKDLLAEYRKVPALVGARLDPWTDCHGNGACWQAQFTATLGATRATLGQVARSAPGVASSMERSAAATERATAATAEAMHNVAELSRPLPKWLRLPLHILGPTAPVWVPMIGR